MAMRYRRTSSMAALQTPHYEYEDFEPISEWKEDPKTYVLIIDLPGFSKEHVRVSFTENLRGIRVRGERPIGGSRRRRFALEFDLPDNCKPNEIAGKVEDDKLIVNIPKEIIHQPVVDTTSSPAYVKEDTRKPSIFEPVTEQQAPKHPKSQYDTETFEEKTDETGFENKQRDHMVASSDYKWTSDEKQESPYYSSKTTSDVRELEKRMDEEKLRDRERKERTKEPETAMSRIVGREMITKSAGSDNYRESYKGSGAVSRNASMDAKRKEIFNMVGESKTTLQRLARDLDEETQLTVDLALAVLEVVGALGAYVSHRSTSSNRRSNI